VSLYSTEEPRLGVTLDCTFSVSDLGLDSPLL
jgi:hypothetical protein